MKDESVIWDKEGDKKLEDKGLFPYQESHSDTEDIQNEMLDLISELNDLKEKFLEQELTDEESQKVLKFIEKTRQEIVQI